jgi:hypothetical protein
VTCAVSPDADANERLVKLGQLRASDGTVGRMIRDVECRVGQEVDEPDRHSGCVRECLAPATAAILGVMSRLEHRQCSEGEHDR